MAAQAGRTISLTWNGSAPLGVRQKDIAFNGEEINVTSDEDNGWQTLLTISGERNVEITVSGVVKDRRFKDDWAAGTRTRTAVLTAADGTIISGSFFLSAYKEGAPYNDAVTFDATLKSTGEVSYTAGS